MHPSHIPVCLFQSARLDFRKLAEGDFAALCAILQDERTMYAWEHGFTAEEVHAWVDKNLHRYETDGFSYFAAIRRDTGELIGVMGPLMEEVEDTRHIGIAYILRRDCWHCGYAAEGAAACQQYAFEELHAEQVIAQIRPENTASRRVAERLGMTVTGQFVKTYRGKDMPHLIYAIGRAQAQAFMQA